MFRFSENMDKVLSFHYFRSDRPKITEGLTVELSWKTKKQQQKKKTTTNISNKQLMGFQIFKIMQDSAKLFGPNVYAKISRF